MGLSFVRVFVWVVLKGNQEEICWALLLEGMHQPYAKIWAKTRRLSAAGENDAGQLRLLLLG